MKIEIQCDPWVSESRETRNSSKERSNLNKSTFIEKSIQIVGIKSFSFD